MSVISLSAERDKRKPKAKAKRDFGPQFYCLRCDASTFCLYASGAVHCEHCGAHMKNLTIDMGDPKTA